MKCVLGIDPGLSGGLALLYREGIIVEPMPAIQVKKGHILDLATVSLWMKSHRDDIHIAYLEQVSARPGQGVSSTFKFGRSYGAIEGMLTVLGIPYELVTPQKWTKVMHAGIEAADTKAKSVIACSRLFPAVNFFTSERCKKPHDGMVEAALIAQYGYRCQGNV